MSTEAALTVQYLYYVYVDARVDSNHNVPVHGL